MYLYSGFSCIITLDNAVYSLLSEWGNCEMSPSDFVENYVILLDSIANKDIAI